MARSPQHQGVFWPDQKSQKLKFQVSFLGLNIALSPNLIGSSDADFHKDSESGLNSKIKKNTKESFVQITVEKPYRSFAAIGLVISTSFFLGGGGCDGITM